VTDPDIDDSFPDAWACFWAGFPCPECGDHVAACSCGDWGCNLSSHDALTCRAQRDDDLLDDPVRLCECGHAAQAHRNDRSCIFGVTTARCPCDAFVAR